MHHPRTSVLVAAVVALMASGVAGGPPRLQSREARVAGLNSDGVEAAPSPPTATARAAAESASVLSRIADSVWSWLVQGRDGGDLNAGGGRRDDGRGDAAGVDVALSRAAAMRETRCRTVLAAVI